MAGLDEELKVLSHLQIVTLLRFPAATLLLYEYALTLNLEIQYVWKKKLNHITVLYFLNRYLPFIDQGLALTHQLSVGLSSQLCSNLYSSTAWMFYLGMGLTEGILIIRTWALWGRDNRVLWTLIASALVMWTGGAVAIPFWSKSLIFTPSPSPAIRGCFIIHTNNLLYVLYLVVVVFETAVLALTAYRVFRTDRVAASRLVRVLYSDGVLFYVYLLVLSIINVAILLAAPPELGVVLIPLHRVMHSVLASRVLFHLRGSIQGEGQRAAARASHNYTYPLAPQDVELKGMKPSRNSNSDSFTPRDFRFGLSR